VHDAWTIAGFVVALVAGIAAVQALVWIPIILWFRRRYRAAQARLASELATETIQRGPEKGIYRGATAPNYPAVINNGMIALTRQRLVFLTVTGKLIEIPLAAITGLRESKVFKSSIVGGRTHLVVGTSAGEIAFFVRDNSAWLDALRTAR
jgi:hypothetical protein